MRKTKMASWDEYFDWVRTLDLPNDVLRERDQPEDDMRLHTSPPLSESSARWFPLSSLNTAIMIFKPSGTARRLSPSGEKAGHVARGTA